MILAVSYSLFSPILWACIKFEVLEDNLGTAYGIVFSIYNLLYVI